MRDKILFLDFDGVVNSIEYAQEQGTEWRLDEPTSMIDPKAVAILNTIVQRADCDIVVSSTWRIHFSLNNLAEYLEDSGFRYSDRIVGKTPNLFTGERGDEILNFINNCEYEINKIAILDDNSDMGDVIDYLVQTTWAGGLQDKHVDQVMSVFKSEQEW